MVGLGLCVIDHVYEVEALDLAATRTRYGARAVQPGGMVTTALAQAARLGCETQLLSAVGDDADGRHLRRLVRACGVGTRGLRTTAALPTTVAVVLVRRGRGDRRFLVPDRRGLEARAPDLDLAPIRAGSVLLVDGHFPAQARRALRRAREVGAPVVADFSRYPGAARALLRHVTHPIVPREFCDGFAGGDVRATLRGLRALGGGTPVVTLGGRGALWLDGGRVRRVRPTRVRVRDTTGAGDVFHGAFAACLARGLPVAACLEAASRAAAVACTALGGTGRLASWRELRPGRCARR